MAESTPNPTVEAVEEPEMAQPRRSRRGIAIAIILVIVLVAVGVWWHSTFSVDTDDASINGHLMQISARVGGHVAKIYVQENQQVKAGDPIADLDPSDFQVAVENAQAALAQADAAAAAAQVFVPITSANTGSSLHSASSDVASTQAGIQQAEKQFEAARARVAQAEANNVRAQSDLARYRPLVEKDVISKQQFDGAEAAAKAAAADLAGARASQQAAGDGIRMARERESQSQAQLKYAQTGPQQVQVQSARAKAALAQVQQAQAQLDQAKLNLSYTHIVAPANGIVTRKSVELDQNISPGQNLLTLVSLDDLWVTANFKETQLKHMHNGQEAEIGVDSTGRKYHGRITQIGGATGSVLSLFPPENATGNYVKVVQRIPVRIDFTDLKNEDSAHALRPGLSVEPKVSVK